MAATARTASTTTKPALTTSTTFVTDHKSHEISNESVISLTSWTFFIDKVYNTIGILQFDNCFGLVLALVLLTCLGCLELGSVSENKQNCESIHRIYYWENTDLVLQRGSPPFIGIRRKYKHYCLNHWSHHSNSTCLPHFTLRTTNFLRSTFNSM